MVRVLVVEDNPHVARLIREGLAGGTQRTFGDRFEFEFEVCTNGREGLDRLQTEGGFHALIIDVCLPVLDGPSVIREIRASSDLHALPVIAVSAGGKAARIEALEAGADYFLEKPMRLSQVLETMRQVLDSRATVAVGQ